MKIQKLDNVEDFKKNIPLLLNKANSSVEMSTSLHPGFYNNESVTGAIQRLSKGNILVRLLLDSRSDINLLQNEVSWLFELQNRHPNVQIAKTDDEIQHIILVDNKHFRIEAPHTGEVGEKNLIVEDAPISIVKPLKLFFQNLWENAKIVTPSSSR